jgi:hypothetical protein
VYGSYAPPLSSPPHLSSTNDVRTLFIAGLPEDVKPREIYNLFREFPGYESSRLRSPNGSSQVYCWYSVLWIDVLLWIITMLSFWLCVFCDRHLLSLFSPISNLQSWHCMLLMWGYYVLFSCGLMILWLNSYFGHWLCEAVSQKYPQMCLLLVNLVPKYVPCLMIDRLVVFCLLV